MVHGQAGLHPIVVQIFGFVVSFCLPRWFSYALIRGSLIVFWFSQRGVNVFSQCCYSTPTTLANQNEKCDFLVMFACVVYELVCSWANIRGWGYIYNTAIHNPLAASQTPRNRQSLQTLDPAEVDSLLPWASIRWGRSHLLQNSRLGPPYLSPPLQEKKWWTPPNSTLASISNDFEVQIFFCRSNKEGISIDLSLHSCELHNCGSDTLQWQALKKCHVCRNAACRNIPGTSWQKTKRRPSTLTDLTSWLHVRTSQECSFVD